jgi:hypothetical protein
MNYDPITGSLTNVGDRHLQLLRLVQNKKFFALRDVASLPGADKLVRNLTARGLLRDAGRLPITGSPKVWTCTDVGRLFVASRDGHANIAA